MSQHRYPLSHLLMSGLVIVVSLSFCLYGAYLLRDQDRDSYPLHANFVTVGGLNVGSSVNLAGVHVGKVTNITLDTQEDVAKIDFSIRKNLKLPTDSRLTISHPTPLAGDALVIEAGHAKTFIPPSSQVKYTQEPLTLEGQLSNYIFGLPSI